jgi:hypothetical protein
MRVALGLPFALVGVVLLVTSSLASGDENHFSGEQLTKVGFDRLIPTSYPTINPSFDRFRPTTSPLIYPEIPQVHITQDLTQSFSRPLLRTSE